MKHHYPSSDLFVVGASSEIYRLNLERGQFMPPYTSTAASINKIDINPAHHLVICGTQNGTVEAWDPRSKSLVGTLDCAFHCVNETKRYTTITFHKEYSMIFVKLIFSQLGNFPFNHSFEIQWCSEFWSWDSFRARFTLWYPVEETTICQRSHE